MKFRDMPYSRPDIEEFRREGAALTKELTEAPSAEAAFEVFSRWEALESRFETLYSLAYVRHTLDTTDEFYDQESTFFDEVLPQVNEILQQMTLALLQSPFRPDFEKKFGTLLFTNAEMQLKTFSPAIMPQLQEENKLVSEYVKLLASAQIPFRGETYTLAQLGVYKQVADDETRRAAWAAEGKFYKENGAALDRIYDELTHLRDGMAKALGQEDYRTLGYYRMQRNSYTREDVDKFRQAIRTYIVPIADRLYREQAKRTGVAYPLSFADAPLTFRSGNATPKGTPDDILAHAKTLYHELSPETAEFVDFLYDNELLDVLSTKGKAGGGYCTSFPDYKAPFIFANFNGTSSDVETMTHEAGHAFAGYMARDIYPREYASPSLESCEIHSMSMEFFAWPWEEGFFKEDTDKFYYGHLAGAITFLPYGTMVDHFQHIVYEKPEMTPAQRHETWKELLGMYMPWMALDGSDFYGEGKGWQRQSHIYENPFYYIDYCLAQTVALEFWALMQKDRADAWERYLRLVRKGGTQTFTQLVETAGLATPFGETALREVADAATRWLDSRDMSALQ